MVTYGIDEHFWNVECIECGFRPFGTKGVKLKDWPFDLYVDCSRCNDRDTVGHWIG